MYRCGYCGNTHEGIPTDLAYRRPVHYLLVPESERPQRCMENDDFCVVDGSAFLVRGIMQVHILDQVDINLTWGMWASISRNTFDKCYELFEKDGSNEPPMKGLLAVSPNGYPELFDQEVLIHLRGATERPVFYPVRYDHPLFIEQRDGITTKRWHEIVLTAMPWLNNLSNKSNGDNDGNAA